ncbi:MAG: Y-family DNA polymerase [Rickettsiales bacterium]|nr:Y-family DNA polymerase [Rickettsiales bacterium]
MFRPDWEDKPIAVLSNNDGCIIARSNELKAAGIPMGAPYFKFKEQLEQIGAIVVSSNYTLYGDMSARVMNMLGRYTPDLEIYSIDEAWLDLTGFDTATLDAYGREIVNATYKSTGIPVSMGIAPTKVLAKLANRICKKSTLSGRVFNLGSADNIEEILAEFEVGDVWGIGRRLAERLNAHGIYSALDLRDADAKEMRKRYSVVMERLIFELRGIPCLEFEAPEPKQEIMASRSFSQRVTDKESLIESVSFHATRAAEKLRKQGSACGVMRVSIRSGRHNPNERYFAKDAVVRFPVPTADTRRMIAAARLCIEQIYRPNVRYAKAGVSIMDICYASEVQGNIFERPDDSKSQSLMTALDKLNGEYGKRTLHFASEGIKKTWDMKRDRMTPAYTTRWADVPSVS